ncbi:GGDEF domain-containing phosphodiesterase [Rheinheimera sp. 1928-s]|uniref:putative bifunctional diguanylate cyclase/phosphodiesterase n=1 Tax=Rheinheimera sp. 1928-s TaxID=3033803 RepID=UPI002614880C|nr:GGDEF domain-containing phosphodiesterase [Rheinheimera sp. 1928-s]MDF3123861.1 EAL domain-containing protein [Rheinheimera sp. 1928-s]
MSSELLARTLLHLTQIGFAITLSALLWYFFRIYQRNYLKSWAIAFCCFTAYATFVLVDVFWRPVFAAAWLGQMVKFLLICFCYGFAVWILVGVFEAVKQQRLAARKVNQLLLLVTGISFLSVVPFLLFEQLQDWVVYLQLYMRLLLIGAALCVAGFWLWSLTKLIFATKVVASAMLAWGLLFLGSASTIVWQKTEVDYYQVAMYFKHLELLIQVILGLGLIIWLQEDERSTNQQLTAKTQYLDSHDPLTGALNRDALLRELALLLQNNAALTLLMIGLDSFKVVNESVGLKQGDRILREVNRRFESSIVKPRLIARTGGDIFALVLDDCSTDRQKLFALQHLEQLIEKPFTTDNGLIKLTASIGLACAPQHAVEADLLLQKANIAFHHCKRQQQRCTFYQPGMEEESARLLSLEKDLLLALEQDQFIFYFQPQWDLREQRIEAFEALVRWEHPQKGLLMPGQFLPLVEQVGLSKDLDLLLLEKAVSTLAEWKKQGINSIPIAVNMSPVHFQVDGLKGRIQQLLLKYQVSPAVLELEITENTAMGDMEKGSNYINELQQMGIRVSIDDFGTGYSSLGYLRKMPIDKIKIDRSFVTDMAANDSDMMIVKTMITLAHGLGKRILAEGVETETQLQLLRTLACDAIQGYLLSKPLPEAEALALLNGCALS